MFLLFCSKHLLKALSSEEQTDESAHINIQVEIYTLGNYCVVTELMHFILIPY